MKRWLGIAAALLATAAAGQAQRYDIVIAGGRVMDGTGNPAFRADVGITGDRVAAIGDLSNARAGQRIDASGKLVTPGFIDIHSHAYDPSGPGGTRLASDDDPARLAAPNLVTQGITTVVTNHDGRSPWPIRSQRAQLEKTGAGTNVLLMVGHGAIRGRVMGDDVRRHSRPDEIEKMRAMVREAMRDGAFGLSAGVEYAPGRWSSTDEIVELAREIVPYRGVYISHQRSEGTDPMWFWPSQDEPGPPTLLDAVSETIAIGERSGATVVASHLKAKGEHFWGASRAAIELIERARARGVEIYADQYPYATSGTDGATVLLPPWALLPGGEGLFAASARAGGDGADYGARLQAVLADPAKAAALRTDVTHEIRRRGGADQVLILAHPDPAFVGQTLGAVAEARGVDPVEMAILLQTEGDRGRPGGAHLRGFSMAEVDLDLIAARKWVATSSDAGIALIGEDVRWVHPRFYGAFPRKLHRYAMEREVLSLEDAVRSSTSLPAQIMGLDDRGILREGAAADVVVLDPTRLRDVSTAQDVHKYSEGIDWVLVNGRPVVAEGKPNGALPGKVIRNPRAGR